MKQAGIALVALALLVPAMSFAQTPRSYHYSSIVQVFDVEKDSTVQVTETQTYAFNGEYHQGERIIPHKAVDAITDISVTDETGQPLTRVSHALDKTDPGS